MKKFLLGALGIVAISSLGFAAPARRADFWGTDAFRARRVSHPDIVILAIDDASIQAIGRWPWPRTVHADLIRTLSQARVRALAIDINFSEPETLARDTALAEAIAQAGFPIVLPVEFTAGIENQNSGVLLPLTYFREPSNVSLGYVNVPSSIDQTARLMPHAVTRGLDPAKPSPGLVRSLAAELAVQVGATLPDPGTSLQGVNFVGPAGTVRTYPVHEVLNGGVPLESLRDKIVFLGATASDLHDTVAVPLKPSLMAGVEWHANVLDNILLSRPLRLPPAWLSPLLALLLSLLALGISWRLPLRRAVLAVAGLAGTAVIASFLFFQARIVLPYLFPISVALLVFLGHGLYRWYMAEAEKRKLRRTFQNYFSAPVMEAIMKNPAALQLGGERREISILFSDIRSFTTITETTPPETLSALLHEYFTEMTEEILATDGVVDKFIGDAIMAFWGAPLDQADHSERAVRAAVGMMKRLAGLQKKWEAQGWPHVDIGIGIHTGFATVGNMGSAKRFDYTIIGDSVNAASRLEGLNKEYKTHIIVSEETAKRLPGDIPVRPLGEVVVKGKTTALKILEVICQ